MSLEKLGLINIRIDIDRPLLLKPILLRGGDYKTRGILIQFIKNGEVVSNETISCSLLAIPSDGVTYFKEGERTADDKYKILFPTSLYQEGIIESEIRLFEGEKILNVSNLNLYAIDSIVDGDIVDGVFEETLINQLLAAMQNESERVIAENIRIANEIERIEAEEAREESEDDRELSESTRSSNESTRQSNESTRINNENTRIQAENLRAGAEATRISNEDNRIDSEGDRALAEDERQSNEAIRQSNENVRISSESNRSSSEQQRVTAESGRVAAEITREGNEDTRKSNELTRMANEDTREIQEANRISNMQVVEGWINNPGQFKGEKGDNIEYNWDGTKLGVKTEGEADYDYSDLKGEKGDSLQHKWLGTQLGIKTDKEVSYSYADLRGPKGETGAGLNILGSLNSEQDLPSTGELGDGYLIDGDLYVWNGTSFENVGKIKGEPGSDANVTKENIELALGYTPLDEERVKTDVPANAKFTDTTYAEITESEIDAGTASSKKTITGRRVGYIFSKVQGWINALTKTDIGLSNVDNIQQATKTEFNQHNNDNTRHITGAERTAWGNKWDYNENTIKGVKVNKATDADTVNGKTVAVNVPAGAKFTDTVTTVNNTLTSTSTTEALSARQGKQLKDDLDEHKAEDATQAHKINNIQGLQTELDGKAKTVLYTSTLNTTWNGSEAPFTKEQTITGVLANDTPIIDVVMSGTFATDEARQEAWGSVYRAVTSANKVTFYATDIPEVEIPIQLKVVR